MKRVARILLGVLAGYVALALALDAVVGVTQVQLGGPEGVLHTTDADGQVHESRMIVLRDGDEVWVQSGHHFRGWYHRLVANPEVALDFEGELRPYTAVALEDPASKAHIHRLIEERVGAVRARVIRVILLFADVKPVRLDPRPRARPSSSSARSWYATRGNPSVGLLPAFIREIRLESALLQL